MLLSRRCREYLGEEEEGQRMVEERKLPSAVLTSIELDQQSPSKTKQIVQPPTITF